MSKIPALGWLGAFKLLALAAIPSLATALVFAHEVTSNRWLLLPLVLLYLITVCISYIVKIIWQQLAPKWMKQLADWIDIEVQSALSKYHKRYCRYLTYQHRDFDVKGLTTQGIYTLELEQVFVEVSIDPTPAHQANPDLLRLPDVLRQGEHSIWDYLSAEPLKMQHLVIIGPPGSGKTTLLKHITLTVINRKKARKHDSNPYTLPFLLFLREYDEMIRDRADFSLVDAIAEHLKKWEKSIPVEWIMRRLIKGRCLVLLDGLDEIADAKTRHKMVDWVEHQMVIYGKNRFLITSRPHGYQNNPLSKAMVLEVHPFTPNQVELFVRSWYLTNEIMSSQKDDAGVRMIAKEGAKDLMRRLHELPALFSLAVNPLLLTMITTVHRYRGSLPGTRVALYAEICDVFLGKRQEAKGVSVELSPAQKMNVLQPLAYHMMCHGIREISSYDAQEVIKSSLKLVKMQMTPLAFLQLIENTSGLLLERETGEYSFAHLTFQEYLTAKYVRENRLITELKAGIEKSWWHETIRLYCAQDDATPIIAACIMKDHPSVSELTLAIECQKEALKVQSYINSQFDIVINRGAEDIDPLRRRVVAEALLAKRLREMAHLVSDVYIDTSLISCAEYQVFLDEQRNRGISRKPDHWIGEHFLPGQAYSPVLGVRLSDALAFCEWLTEKESGVWRYRLPVLGEQQLDTKNYTVSLKQKIGYWLSDETRFTWLGGILSPTDKPLNIESSRIQSCIVVSNRYEAVANSNGLARAYILALIHDRRFARILSRFLNTHDRKLIQNPTNDLNIVRAIDLARTLENDLDLTRALTYDFELSSALFTDHVHELVLDIARVLGRDCTLIHNLLAHDHIIILNDAFTHTLIQALDQAYNYAVTFIQTKDANSFHGLYTTFVDILSNIARLVLDRGSDYNRLCRFICDLALIDMGITLLNNHFQFINEDGIQPTRPWWYFFQFHRRALQVDMEYKHNFQASCDIYENFLILEMRIQKKLPAYESILVVKERKKIDE